jgi:hypothetical protein
VTIPEKIRAAVYDPPFDRTGRALLAVLDKADAWRAAGMPWSALGDELLLTVAPALGLRIEMGPFAQLVDLDEEGP